MNAHFIVNFISVVIRIYIWLILARVIISFMRPRTYHPILRFIYDTTEPLLGFCRRLLPGAVMNVDFSPFIAIILLEILRAFLMYLMGIIF
ncbi:YggT family protein [Syntrophaceticus schinkii]|jgi:YggT family protein|uniref:Predicted integral membrane protein n=1 Tax=Syntrophaceticus schinkii TaxID=499207 RepID=A0A0B7MIK5_9FIRM|nr:YggT family protein [Syntrophaceticus schinkii]CEO87482.1 Predicted integral membrane protein [Syntrophaceticus schinkii]